MRGRALWARGTEPGGAAEASGSGSGGGTARGRGRRGYLPALSARRRGKVAVRGCARGGVPAEGGKEESWERRRSDPLSLPRLPSPPPAVAQRKEGCDCCAEVALMPSGAHRLVTCPPHAWVFPLRHQQRRPGEGAGQLVTPGLSPAEGEAAAFCQNAPFRGHVLASAACASLDELVRHPIPRCPTRTAQKPTHPRAPPPSLPSWKCR